MTKKDFQLIAQAIGSLPKFGVWRVEEIAKHFADALSATNPLFKRDLFIQAATGVVPVTARKAIKRCEGCVPGQFWCGKCDSVKG